ncbi:hypothetical protein OA416_03605 [Paracoccaceae bacterium]|nr:hypothetical protein [Paracoccaceae bacterium]
MQTFVTGVNNLISFRECFGRAQELEERLKFNDLVSRSGQQDNDQRFP